LHKSDGIAQLSVKIAPHFVQEIAHEAHKIGWHGAESHYTPPQGNQRQGAGTPMSDITTQVRNFRPLIFKHLLDGGCDSVLADEIAREAFITATQLTVERLTREERATYLCAIADRLLAARKVNAPRPAGAELMAAASAAVKATVIPPPIVVGGDSGSSASTAR